MMQPNRELISPTQGPTGFGSLNFPAITTAFLASLVEAIEALTIVLAVATVRGWRPAGLGAFAGIVLLGLTVLAIAATANIPRNFLSSDVVPLK